MFKAHFSLPLKEDREYNGPYFSNMAKVIIIPFYGYFFGQIDTAANFLNYMFGDVGYGIASNIWAEAYVVGGWELVVLFSFTYSVIPYIILNKLIIKFDTNSTRSFIVIIGVIILFYIHRIGAEMCVVMCMRLAIFYLPLRFLYLFTVRHSNK